MWTSGRFGFAFLVASFTLTGEASAVTDGDQDVESEFTHTGFYVGVGGTATFPHNWNSDFDGELSDESTDLANDSAQASLDALPAPRGNIVPLTVTVGGAGLEDAQFGVNAVVGYRAGALIAFEVEGEWVITSNKSDLDVDAFAEPMTDVFVSAGSSSGTHKVEVDEIWNVTANVKVYPPVDGWLRFLERFQPFAKVGLGVQHSRMETDIETSGLTTTNKDSINMYELPANFGDHPKDTSLDGVLRVGGGIDIYATRNIISEITATYVAPFSQVDFLDADYVSVQWRLVYRF